MFNIASYYKPIKTDKIKKKTVAMSNASKDVEKLTLLYTSGGNVKWDSCSGKDCSSF